MSEKPGVEPPPYEAHGQGTSYKPDETGYSQNAPGQPGYPPGQPGYPPGQPGYPAGQPGYPGQPYSGQGGYQPPPPGYNPQYGYTTAGYTTTVTQPGAMQMQAPPPDHFCLAVFVTLCCFWPTGILAIMKASDARSSVARGDMNTAHTQARSAKQMINVSIGIGIASIILVAVIVGVYVGVVLNSFNSLYD